METVQSLPVNGPLEFLLGKAIPYFFIGLIDVLVSVLMGQILFGVVMKSSFWLMVLASSVYLGVALTLGLLISTLTKSQLAANQIAILITYLPSLLLSDFVFPIVNMPPALQEIDDHCAGKIFYQHLKRTLPSQSGPGADLWPDYGVLCVMFVLYWEGEV